MVAMLPSPRWNIDISVAKGVPFEECFFEMMAPVPVWQLGFFIGFAVRKFLGAW